MAVKLQPYKLNPELEACSLSRLDNPVLTLQGEAEEEEEEEEEEVQEDDEKEKKPVEQRAAKRTCHTVGNIYGDADGA